MLTCFGMISYVAIELALAHLIVTVMLRLLISSKNGFGHRDILGKQMIAIPLSADRQLYPS